MGAGRKLARGTHVHIRRAALASGQDGTAVFARDGDDFGARVDLFEHIAHGFNLQIFRTGAVQGVGLVSDVSGRCVAGAVFRLAGHSVAPVIADDAGAVRVGP